MAEKTRKKSPMAKFERLSPNRSKPRTGIIRRLTPHHAVGNLTPEVILGLPSFQNYSTETGASANYAIGSDGKCGLGVEETNRPWTSSNFINDQESITTEIANDGAAPDWHISSEAINAWMDQAVETAIFYGFKKFGYVPKPSNIATSLDRTTRTNQAEAWIKTWAKDGEMIITLHNWFTTTICPGPYFERQLPWIVKEMNKRLADSKYQPEEFVGEGETATGQPIPLPIHPTDETSIVKSIDVIAREVINGSWGNGQDRINRLTAAGYDSAEVQAEVNRQTSGSTVSAPTAFKEYEILITAAVLNVRKGPSINETIVRTLVNDKNVYTIIEEKVGPSGSGTTDKWGKLKSGLGWILLTFTKRK